MGAPPLWLRSWKRHATVSEDYALMMMMMMILHYCHFVALISLYGSIVTILYCNCDAVCHRFNNVLCTHVCTYVYTYYVAYVLCIDGIMSGVSVYIAQCYKVAPVCRFIETKEQHISATGRRRCVPDCVNNGACVRSIVSDVCVHILSEQQAA